MKNKIRKLKEIPVTFWGKIILLGFLLICLNSALALAVDFVTQAEFEAEKSTYKNYPLNILFKRLAKSDASEKRIIRNTIVLKQAFDRNIQKMEKEGIIAYKTTFGMIKGVDRNSLKLWVPATDRSVDFYVGIDRIPLINEHNYNITTLNIGKYAAVTYTLDNRIYKIKVSFQPETPSGLKVQRENDNNIVAWNPPPSAQKPFGYKVFINEKLFKQVEETNIKVPWTIEHADDYYVKAIYKHGDGIIESDATDILTDEITANEIQQKQLALDRQPAAVEPTPR
jgi:hypothetical protein